MSGVERDHVGQGAQVPFAVSYLRFSTPEQAKGDSVRRQLQAAAEWSERTGIRINETIRDQGVSAFRGENALDGNLARFLLLVKSGRIPRGTYLLVESLDRLSRQAVLKAMPRLMEVIGAGVRIVSLADGAEYSEAEIERNPAALFLWLGSAIRANQESALKSFRIRQSWDSKRRRAADGVVMTARLPAWLKAVGSGRDRRIEEDPERVLVVRRIFRMTIDGYGRRRIVHRLNQDGVPAFRSAARWQPSSVLKILCSRAVLGELQPYGRDADGVRVPSGPVLKNYFPAIVPEADFNRAAAAIGSRKAAGGVRGPEHVNLFQGLVYCALCSHRMAMENKGAPPKGGRYYVCSSFARRAGCSNASRFRVDQIETAVFASALRIDWSALEGPDRASFDLTIAQKHALIEDLKTKRSRVDELAEAGNDAMMARSKDLTSQILRLSAELAEALRERDEATSVPPPSRRQEILEALRAKLESADRDRRAELRTKISQVLRWSVESVRFHKEQVSVRYRRGLHRGPGQEPPTVAVVLDTPANIAAKEQASLDAQLVEAIERAERGPVRRLGSGAKTRGSNWLGEAD